MAFPPKVKEDNHAEVLVRLHCTFHTPYAKMAATKLFFCLHVYEPSLPHFHFKILLCFLHADEASRAN